MKSRRTWLLGVLAVILGVGLVLIIYPLVQTRTMEDGPGPNSLPEVPTQVEIVEPHLLLPTEAGAPARIHLTVNNYSEDSIQITEVAIAHGDDTILADLSTPVVAEVASVDIGPGMQKSFGPGSEFTILSDYDSWVVPGAEINLRLTFGDGSTITVPIEVVSAVGQGGEIVGPELSEETR